MSNERKSLNVKVKDILVEKYIQKLSPEAQNLTCGDLFAIARNENVPHALKVTIGDLKTLNEVFMKYAEGEEGALARKGGALACCCCSAPCCCCCGVLQ